MRKLYRILFSRYAFCAAVIFIELSVTVAVLLYASFAFAPFYAICLSIEIITAIAVINDDMNPEYKIPWLVIVLALPLFGFVVYFALHTRRMSRSESERLEESIRDARRSSNYECRLGALGEESLTAAAKALSLLGDDPLARVYSGTDCEYFPSGEQMFERMLADLSGAREFIFLEYFIIDCGFMWSSILEILEKKAAAGIEVRILYDDIGCMTTLPQGYDRVLRDKGIACFRFSPITPRVSCVHNNRDHRKIAVIDGSVAYTGGINLADEYIGRRERYGVWKDGGVRLAGSAASGLCAIFLSGWELASGEVKDKLPYLRTRPENNGEGYFIPFASGPKPVYKQPVGKNVFLNIINQAQTFIYISTPYLIIDYELTEAIRAAAKRGVEVKIITPGTADKPLVKIMTKSSYRPLIEAGAEIFEYASGFIHEKMLISDTDYAVVGTINFDYRSLVHHYENAVWIYRAPCIKKMTDEFMKTLSLSRGVVGREAKLGFFEAAFKNIARIFAPLL